MKLRSTIFFIPIYAAEEERLFECQRQKDSRGRKHRLDCINAVFV